MRLAKLVPVLLALSSTLCAADPSVGAWKINLAKTKYSVGTAPKEQTVAISESGADLTVKINGVLTNGTKVMFSYTMPAAGGPGKVIEASNTPYDGVSAKRISATERELSYLKAGKPLYTAHVAVSADGNTMTVHGKGVNAAGQTIEATSVYDKQK